MARESKTRYALLGLLSRQPMSGYDIKRAVEQSLSYFWHESYGQIYPMLNGLAEDGLASRCVERQEGRPDRHVYAITDAGRNALEEWLRKPADPQRERVEVLLKVFFGSNLPVAETLRHIERARQEHEALLTSYEETERKLQGEWAGPIEASFGLATVRCGIHVSRAMLAWCDETTAALARLESTPAGRRKSGGNKHKLNVHHDEENGS